MLAELLGERRIDAGGGLIEHDQLRLGHQRAAELEQLLLSAGEIDRAVVADRQQVKLACDRDRTLAQFAHPAIRFDHVVTRRAGQRRFLDLHMHMPASWTLGRAAALRSDVEQALMSEVPGLRASIQLLPSDVEAHFNDPVDPQL